MYPFIFNMTDNIGNRAITKASAFTVDTGYSDGAEVYFGSIELSIVGSDRVTSCLCQACDDFGA